MMLFQSVQAGLKCDNNDVGLKSENNDVNLMIMLVGAAPAPAPWRNEYARPQLFVFAAPLESWRLLAARKMRIIKPVRSIKPVYS